MFDKTYAVSAVPAPAAPAPAAPAPAVPAPAAPAPAAPAPAAPATPHNLSPEEVAARVRELYPEAKHLTTVVMKLELTLIQLEKVFTCLKFAQWIKNFKHKIRDLRKIEVRDVFWFGPNPGFITINVDAYNSATDKSEPAGYVLIRGGAVAVLVRVSVDGELFVLLARQLRIPAGDFLIEAIAGMMDNDKNPIGVALKELREESGIELTKELLIPVGKVVPSGGGCDERLDCYVTPPIIMDEARFAQILAQTHGVEGESIQIVAYPINTRAELLALIEHGDSKINTCVLGLLKLELEEATKAAAVVPKAAAVVSKPSDDGWTSYGRCTTSNY
uniref:Uncharacterized protein n=1 Tax=viral metagenome TaxID=1070528 RepID=A0A6C0HNC3_9ZZZZ